MSFEDIAHFTDEDLIKELRNRQRFDARGAAQQTAARRRARPRSAPHQRGKGPQTTSMGSTGWDAPAARFGGSGGGYGAGQQQQRLYYSQGPHPRSTLATKLSRAKVGR
jgi:hypothetical protein